MLLIGILITIGVLYRRRISRNRNQERWSRYSTRQRGAYIPRAVRQSSNYSASLASYSSGTYRARLQHNWTNYT